MSLYELRPVQEIGEKSVLNPVLLLSASSKHRRSFKTASSIWTDLQVCCTISWCWTLHLDTYSVYYTFLGAFYNFKMKYPLKCATFVDSKYEYVYRFDKKATPSLCHSAPDTSVPDICARHRMLCVTCLWHGYWPQSELQHCKKHHTLKKKT